MGNEYYSALQVREYVKGVFNRCDKNYSAAGREIDVSSGLVWKMVNNTQTDSALIRLKCGLPKPPRLRSQITWESQAQKDGYMEYIKARGHKSPSSYARMLGDWQLEAQVLDLYDPFSDKWSNDDAIEPPEGRGRP